MDWHEARRDAGLPGALRGFQLVHEQKKCKTIIVIGRGGPQSCETTTLPHFLDKRLTDGGEVVSVKRRLRSTSQKHFLVPIYVRV
jgi:hypothetical protein